MKKNFLLLVGTALCSLGHAQTSNPAPYCASVFDNNYNMIQSVTVNNTMFATGPQGSWPSQNTYTFFNNATFPTLSAGSTATIGISFYSVTDWEPRYFGVWIDFNANNTFDNSELVMNNAITTNTELPTGGGPPQLITLPISIPSTAMSGTTRMRIVRAQAPTGSPYLPYSSTVQVLACNPLASDQAYGNTYDFNLVIASGNAPVANFNSAPSQPCSGKTITLSDMSTNAATSWTYTAPGASNSLSTVQNPTLSYANAGTYTITLVSANAAGMSAPISKTINIIATPQLSISPNVVSICAKKNVMLAASGADTYSWSTGAISASLSVSPSVTTVYTVTGTNANVCSAVLSKTLNVSACTNIDEALSDNQTTLSIYPNPGNGTIRVQSNFVTQAPLHLVVTNALGQQVSQYKYNETMQLNLSEFPKGIYFISLFNDQQLMATKKYLLQ